MIKVDNKEEDNLNAEASANSAFRCGNCIACFRVSDCEKCPNCLTKSGACLRRVCVQAGLNDPTTSQATNNDSGKQPKKDTTEQKKKLKKKETKNNGIKKNKMGERLQQQSPSKEITEIVVPKRKPHKPHKPHVWRPKELRGIKKSEEVAHQCLGPGCAKAARQNSKYCSDNCGLNLADHRLQSILRDRVTDFYRLQPNSEKVDDKKIRELTVKKAETEADLEIANKYAELFDLYISSFCKAEPTQSNQPQTSSKESQSFLVFCPVCAEEFTAHKLFKHIEDCSSEQERRFAYGSKYSLAAENPDGIICDQYDPFSQTYCKRLRFSCAEHYNDSIGSKMKICGYPFQWSSGHSMRLQDMFTNIKDIVSSGICTRKRDSCHEHKFWEQNVRALLDNHRMRLMLCLDELATEYYHIFEAYRTRGDALTLLINSRKLSHETALKEESDYQAEQMASTGYLTQKQEELSIENLYHTIRASRSAQSSTNSSQTLSTNGLLESSLLLNGGVANSNDLLNLLLQKGIQVSSNNSYTNMVAETSTGIRPTATYFGPNENVLEGFVKIEQQL